MKKSFDESEISVSVMQTHTQSFCVSAQLASFKKAGILVEQSKFDHLVPV